VVQSATPDRVVSAMQRRGADRARADPGAVMGFGFSRVSVADRLSSWVDVVGDVLQRPARDFPHQFLCDRLQETFDVTGVSWDWQDSPDRFGFVTTPATLMISGEARQGWAAGGLQDGHPLLRWHVVTGDPAPQSSGRVPSAVLSRVGRSRVQTLLRTFGCEQQLSLNYQLGRGTHRAFILARTGPDFCDDDVEVARRLQPVLMGLRRQFDVLGTRSETATRAAAACGLTGRESAVLALLADGLTAQAIAHRLSMSPRTGHKHLEHVYRKLGVRDRLNAGRIANDAELLMIDRRSFPPAEPSAGESVPAGS